MLFAISTEDEHRQSSLFKIICHLEKKDGQQIERVVGIHAIGKGIDEVL
jgi:hypothetical protein